MPKNKKKGDNIENRKELEARMKVRAKEFATIKNTFKVTHIIKTKKKRMNGGEGITE